MKTVRIEFCDASRAPLLSTHRKKADEDAIERAVIKHFGLCRTFFSDNQPSTQQGVYYGRVGRYSLSAGGPVMDTERLRIVVT